LSPSLNKLYDIENQANRIERQDSLFDSPQVRDELMGRCVKSFK